MTSVSAWNEMLEQFLTELKHTFPEEKAIKKYYTSFELLKKTNPRKCVEGYMSEIGKYQEKIMNKDESFFLENEDSLIKELNLKAHWTADLSTKTKEAIWQYVQTLFILGTTITMIPADTLSMIEDVAKKCVGDGGNVDENSLKNLLGSLLEKK